MYKDDKYFLEINMNGVVKIDAERRHEIIEKVNKLMQLTFNGEDIVQFNCDVNLVSESSIFESMLAPDDYGIDEGENDLEN